jgi:hypothetical protein
LWDGTIDHDSAAADVRPTFDVDAIAEITSYAEYDKFSERLKKLGFQEDTREGAPLCRWRQKANARSDQCLPNSTLVL